MTTIRRGAAALLAPAVLGALSVPAVAAPSPTPPTVLPSGLYGKSDPTYDGVWRQSLALLAQDAVGVRPADKAVDFLTGQQCADGGFPSYRADAAKACDAKLPRDTNASAAAVQALAGLGGRDAVVKKTTDWLRSVQNEDGGWGYNPGGASDANSTSVVIGALRAAGDHPAQVSSKSGRTPYDALLTFARPCGGKDGGAFVHQTDSPGILADSTAAAVLAANGKGMVAAPGPRDPKAVECTTVQNLADTAHNGAVHLVKGLAETGHFDTPPMPGAEDTAPEPDFGNTADAVVALSAQGMNEQTKKPLTWLQQNASAWARENGPAAYAQLIFAAKATGTDPKRFGATDLVAGLNATGPVPAPADLSTTQKKKDEESDDSTSSLATWWIVGVFFVAAIGVGFLFSGRRTRL
ncbi:terpene cyclase/mutase family protein [Streptomyces sp. ISL-10]|uniref:prenyltransferase/squalene oxidase repeat-containing protein n=1 Tax=Streptomyces sp. ISL-10 TaxID=2819172 RepID=UPI001BEBFB5C|nr:prenyltransferase/squalene oxidase repeat-containing protein [Streptomyces sp. ISL-10]MBT2366333.1 terpene cyclase/mutase family protein [Streptomyces sp. ISL-10]